jgi:hypothetical protein
VRMRGADCQMREQGDCAGPQDSLPRMKDALAMKTWLHRLELPHFVHDSL